MIDHGLTVVIDLSEIHLFERLATMSHAQAVAHAAAHYAHVALFSSRWGSLTGDSHLLIIYDNCPSDADPLSRERVLSRLTTKMAEFGYVDPSRAGYPKRGESEGYTIALVWEGIPDRQIAETILRTVWFEAMREGDARLTDKK